MESSQDRLPGLALQGSKAERLFLISFDNELHRAVAEIANAVE